MYTASYSMDKIILNILYILALKLPLCRVKSGFAANHGIVTESPLRKALPLRPTSSLKSSIKTPSTEAVSTRPNTKTPIKAEDGLSLQSALGLNRVRPRQEAIR